MAHDIFVNLLKSTHRVHQLISEEAENPLTLEGDGPYCIAFDPLDGSSNIECNVSIGTIFGIYRSGFHDLVAAGYCVYGPST